MYAVYGCLYASFRKVSTHFPVFITQETGIPFGRKSAKLPKIQAVVQEPGAKVWLYPCCRTQKLFYLSCYSFIVWQILLKTAF